MIQFLNNRDYPMKCSNVGKGKGDIESNKKRNTAKLMQYKM